MSINPNPLPSSISSSLNQLKLGNLPQLKMSKTAKTTILTQQIIEFIVNEVKVIPNFQKSNFVRGKFLKIRSSLDLPGSRNVP